MKGGGRRERLLCTQRLNEGEERWRYWWSVGSSVAHPENDAGTAAEELESLKSLEKLTPPDDILLPWRTFAAGGEGGTNLGYVKGLGTPKAVATAALLACGGDVGKAQVSLIEKVEGDGGREASG